MHAYVGDEAIATWRVATWRVAKDPTRNARCVACLFAIERTRSGWSASRQAGATVPVRPAVKCRCERVPSPSRACDGNQNLNASAI